MMITYYAYVRVIIMMYYVPIIQYIIYASSMVIYLLYANNVHRRSGRANRTDYKVDIIHKCIPVLLCTATVSVVVKYFGTENRSRSGYRNRGEKDRNSFRVFGKSYYPTFFII